MKTDTLAIHAGQQPDPATGAIMTPIFQTSTYVQDSPGVHKGYEYSRTQNPTRQALEACLASLEGGAHGVCFASGCATTTALLHTLRSGDHVVACDDLYGGTYRLFTQVFQDMGIDFTFADLSDPSSLDEHVRDNTRMVWLETPTNPLLKLVDIQAKIDDLQQIAAELRALEAGCTEAVPVADQLPDVANVVLRSQCCDEPGRRDPVLLGKQLGLQLVVDQREQSSWVIPSDQVDVAIVHADDAHRFQFARRCKHYSDSAMKRRSSSSRYPV